MKKVKSVEMYSTVTVTKPIVISFNDNAVKIASSFEKTFAKFLEDYTELNEKYYQKISNALNEILEDMEKRRINPVMLLYIVIRNMLGLIDSIALYMLHNVCGDKCGNKDIEDAVSLVYEMTILELVSFFDVVKDNVKKRYGLGDKVISSYI